MPQFPIYKKKRNPISLSPIVRLFDVAEMGAAGCPEVHCGEMARFFA